MKRFALPMALAFATAGTALAAGAVTPAQKLLKLDVAVGRWIFHGKSLDTAFGKAGNWTWNEDCGWSANRLFLECSFDNEWSGKKVRSLVVDTYNARDKSYWHYELFAAGAGGARPFVSRMTIAGSTWTESGQDTVAGKRVRERIVYDFVSADRVDVKIQISRDGKRWVTIDRGEGEKQP